VSSEGRPRILVVDDDPDVQTLIGTLFNIAGFEQISALSAMQGAEVLKQSPLPDCLVLDLMMPHVSGMEFLRQIRSKSAFDEMPVVILSALADPDTIRKGLDTGADRYVTKPYLVNSLVKVIQEVLAGGRRH
jgi:DNA-binding response OmpR family regulator